MQSIFPPKLQPGQTIRVVAPSRSLGFISKPNRAIANKRFKQMKLHVEFSKHAEEMDRFASSSIQSRVEDLHAAFKDPKVNAIFTVIGGFNCNQLFKHLDWNLIKKNPKIFCGYSDTTALQNAIYAKTGLVTYSGPAYSTFGILQHFDYYLEYFKKCLFSTAPYEIIPSKKWSDDEWYKNQYTRNLFPNKGWGVLHKGKAKGTIIGANLCTLNLLQGTEYFSELKNSILFLEDDYESKSVHFDRDLQSLLHLPAFKGVRGIVIGRFQTGSKMSAEDLKEIIASKDELAKLPVITEVDFGHSQPMITFPIGGKVEIVADAKKPRITILEH